MPKPNWGGAASGAVSGAAAGSTFGPVGSVVGGTVGFFGGLFGGGKKKPKKRSTLDKRQQQLNENQHKAVMGEGPLADLYNYNPQKANEVFDLNYANPAYRNFRELEAPTITGQFRSGGLGNSSYAADAVARRGREVQEGLEARRSQYQFGLENESRNAKRSAVENLQNRTTFDYEENGQQGQGQGWFDNIMNSVSGKDVDNALGWAQDTALKYLPGGV